MQWRPKTLLFKALPPVAFVALAILAMVIAGLIFLRGLYSRTPYCRVTLVSIEVDQKAHVKMELVHVKMEVAFEHSSGAIRSQTFVKDGVIQSSGSSTGRRFLGRPIRGRFATDFEMELEPDHGERSLKERVTEAIRVKIGETYLITPDEPLLLY